VSWYYSFRPYVSAAQRKAQARREIDKRKKCGQTVSPILIEGRKIAHTFWGRSWCEHLESFSDYENRLPRGRSYVRNGSVVDLQIAGGKVTALVSGSRLYDVTISIAALPAKTWKSVKSTCAGQIGSLVELLQGRLSQRVMDVVTQRDTGLFPQPREIRLGCSCPDYAVMCKHVAAVLYGVGARLDERPELLFLLRQVDHLELLETAATSATVGTSRRRGKQTIASGDLADVFGIEIADDVADAEAGAAVAPATPRRRRSAAATSATPGPKVRRRDAPPKAPAPKPNGRRVRARATTAQRDEPVTAVAAPRKKPRAAVRSRGRKSATPRPASMK
jgi:uncharacterized Zn finger protein